MKRIVLAIFVALPLSPMVRAQQGTPMPPPPANGGEQQVPREPGAPSRSTPPPQAVVPVPVPIAPPKPNGPVQKSLVRITATSVDPDYKAPWNAGALQRGVGAGFVISGNRIMTNAHVVANSRYLTVERDGDPNKYPAQVQFVANDCDLALITVSAPDFFKNMLPLKFGGIPTLESTVSAYGYPIGGERMSVTTGIVSRIDFQLYTHSSVDQHLTIQISAQINPGNSGGPVMQDGKVVGVAFQGYSGDVAQGVAYMIPTPVINRFLKDISNGHYDEYPDMAITYAKLQNPAQRRFLGLKDGDRGVLVSSVIAAGPSDGVLYPGDVLLTIDGHNIASDANVELDGERAQFEEVVERKFKGDTVKFDILRNKQPMTVTINLYKPWPYSIQGHSYDVRPRYVLYGGLLFQPLSLDMLEAYRTLDLRLRHFFEYFILEQIYLQHPDVIVLSNILPDPINTYPAPYRGAIVDEVNGEKIRTLDELAKSFAEAPDKLVIRMIGDGPPLVLDRNKVESARERIKARYNVMKEQNLEASTELAQADKNKMIRQSLVALGIILVAASGTLAKKESAVPAALGKQKQLALVRVNVTGQSYDYFRPWQKKAPFSKRALGAVLSKGRVLVTADLVTNQNYVELERAESGEKTAANVQVIDYEANLALLEPTEKTFLDGITPLEITPDTVVGDRLAAWQLEPTGALLATEGLVTTIQMMPYPIDVGQFLTYRVSIPMQYRENSYTVPLVKNNKLAGLLLRYDSRSQLLDAIPAPIINHFLKEAESQKYRGFPFAGFSFFPTRDPELRQYAGEKGKNGGVYITNVESGTPAMRAGMQLGDVITAVGNHDIDQNGNYVDPLYGKIEFTNLLTAHAYAGDVVPFHIERNGKPMQLNVTLEHRDAKDYVSPPYYLDQPPRYFVVGGLIFQELSRQYLKEWGPNWQREAPQRFVYMDHFQSELFPDRNRRVVILSQVLPANSTIGYDDLAYLTVTKVNGKEVKSLLDLAAAVKEPVEGFIKIETEEDPKQIELDASQVAAEAQELQENYGISSYRKGFSE